jgi:nucleoside-diphosphate-sugar epimerase
MPEIVTVTGSAGFIGRAVVDRLSRAGTPVRAGVRRTPLPDVLAARAEITPVRLDLDTPATVEPAIDGSSTIVHAAYDKPGNMVREMEDLLAAAGRAGVRRVVFVSSIAVYGARTGEVTEAATAVPPLGAYGGAKRRCEASLRRWADTTGGAAAVLRPGIVFGADSPLWAEKLARRIEAGIWGRFGDAGDGLAALVHVRDVGAAVAAAVAADIDGVAIYNLSAIDDVSWNTFFERLAAHRGYPPLPELSAGLLRRRRYGALPFKVLAKLTGGRIHSAATLAPTAAELALFKRRVRYDSARARAELGWVPAIGLEEGLALSALDAGTAE